MKNISKVHQGNVLEILKLLDPQLVNCIVTSPPYFQLRNYNSAPTKWPEISYIPMAGLPAVIVPAMECCLGLEPDPISFIAHLVEIFREAYRVLRDDGTLWLNIGDSYVNTAKNATPEQATKKSGLQGGMKTQLQSIKQNAKRGEGLKHKDLIGIPWRLAFALQADGWYLRQDNIWSKPNPMPESVKDRCTKAHEYIFLLSKKPKYYFNAKAIATQSDRAGEKSYHNFDNKKYDAILHDRWKDQFDGRNWGGEGVANKRSVWSIATHAFPGAHFATFPPDIPETCIKAGCPEGGAVMDMFDGSGTTRWVAYKLFCDYYGIEINPDFIAISDGRMKEFENQLF